MKEQYRKPMIFFESFSLAQTIARNCGDMHDSTLGESNHYNENTCEWDFGGLILFFEPRCEYNVEEGEEIEGLCYNNPDGGQQLFSST